MEPCKNSRSQIDFSLTKEQRKRAWIIALGISDARLKISCLAALSSEEDTDALLRVVVGDLCSGYQDRSHSELLSYLVTPNLFVPGFVDQLVLEAIASSIMEICTEWTWF